MEKQSQKAHNVKDESELYNEIVKELSTVKDEGYKAVLLLQLKILKLLSAKLDAVLEDDATLKKIVLNGYHESHHDHHEFLNSLVKHQEAHKEQHMWVAAKMKDDVEFQEVINFYKDRHKHGGYCDFAHKAMKAQELSGQSTRKIFESVSANLIGVALVAALSFMIGRSL